MSNIPVALVTGGSRGIGRAAAEELAREGYKVALIARTPERLEAAARELVETLGLDAEHAPVTFALDVGDGQAVGDAVDRLAAEWGRIDVLFNSAGVSIPGTLELGADTLDLLYRTNLRAPFLFMKHVIPIMRRQGSGYIFNLASRNGKIGVAGLGGYTASKFGLVGLGEVLYRELAAQGIKVTTLCPGWVNTDMASGEGCVHPPEKMIQPEQIAATMRWLLSLGPSVSIMEVLLECTADVERRATGELHALYALRDGTPVLILSLCGGFHDRHHSGHGAAGTRPFPERTVPVPPPVHLP
ncbi:SDR family oxidoreductase [Bilophila wadsworthia]|uniref:SDR family oxidoreductase n=1 Tax=Bilophila wadsworthia TaxID=35833 RepID=UPI003522BB88